MAFQIRPDPNNPLFTVMVGCLIAATKTTVRNGATRVIPGSHLWGADRAPKLEEAVYAEMEAGSALFTLGCRSRSFLPPDSHVDTQSSLFPRRVCE